MKIWIIAFLLSAGSLFSLLGSIGLLRMKDVYTRAHAASLSTSLGFVFIMLAAVIYFDDIAILVLFLVILAFLVLTVPVATHMIARLAYLSKTKRWFGSGIDELDDDSNKESIR